MVVTMNWFLKVMVWPVSKVACDGGWANLVVICVTVKLKVCL